MPSPAVGGSGWLGQVSTDVMEFLVDLLGGVGVILGGAQAAAAPFLTDLQQTGFKFDPTKAISAADIAAARIKGFMDDANAYDEAKLNGYNESRIDMLTAIAGNPPGPETLLTMKRRGIITDDDVALGMREGYTRNDWIPYLQALEPVLMSPPEAVAAAVQGHLDYGDAQRLAGLSGVGAGTFDTMFQVAGNPPGPMQILTMWNRGIIDEPTAVQALKESRLKDKYIPMVLQLARRRLPLRSVTQLLNAGAISDQDAIDNLRALGYSDADAQRIIAAHRAPAKEVVRHLTVAQIKQLLDAGAINQAEAAADLQTLGYSPADAQAVVSLMVVPPDRKIRQAAITKVRSSYDARKITRAQASNELDRLQIAPDQRDQLLAVWDVELDANLTRLTVAELCTAGRIGAISVDETRTRLLGRGYTAADTETMLMVHRVIPVPGSK